jgi:hypothetical protein
LLDEITSSLLCELPLVDDVPLVEEPELLLTVPELLLTVLVLLLTVLVLLLTVPEFTVC